MDIRWKHGYCEIKVYFTHTSIFIESFKEQHVQYPNTYLKLTDVCIIVEGFVSPKNSKLHHAIF